MFLNLNNGFPDYIHQNYELSGLDYNLSIEYRTVDFFFGDVIIFIFWG